MMQSLSVEISEDSKQGKQFFDFISFFTSFRSMFLQYFWNIKIQYSADFNVVIGGFTNLSLKPYGRSYKEVGSELGTFVFGTNIPLPFKDIN